VPQPSKTVLKKRPSPTKHAPVAGRKKATALPRQGVDDDTEFMALDIPRGKLSAEMQAYFDKCEEKLGYVPNVLRSYGFDDAKLQAFADYRQDLIIGASVQVSAPVGQYDSSKLVNLGANRWFIKPDIGISKALGPLTLELSAGVTFFTRNDDYFGGKTLEQDPVYSTQAHVTFNFGNGVWGALDGTYDYGGRTTVNGVRSDDKQGNSRVGATLALPVNRNQSIKLYGSTGVSTRSGSDYNLGGIAWQYRWGSGL